MELPVWKPVGEECEAQDAVNGKEYGKVALSEIPDSDAVSPPSSMGGGDGDGAVEAVSAVEVVGDVVEAKDASIIGDIGENGELPLSVAKVDEYEKMDVTRSGVEAVEEGSRIEAVTSTEPTASESTPLEPPLRLETVTSAIPPVLREEVSPLDDRLVSPTSEPSAAPRSSFNNRDKFVGDAVVCVDAAKDDSVHLSNPTTTPSKLDRDTEDSHLSPIEEILHLRSPSPDDLDIQTTEDVLPTAEASFLERVFLADEVRVAQKTPSTEEVQAAKSLLSAEIPPSDDEDDAMDEDKDSSIAIFKFHATNGSIAEDPDTFFMNVQGIEGGERPIIVLSSTSEVEVPAMREGSIDDLMDVETSDVPHFHADGAKASEAIIFTNTAQGITGTAQSPSSDAMDVEDDAVPSGNAPFESTKATPIADLQDPNLTTQSAASQSADTESNDARPLSEEDSASAGIHASPPNAKDLSAATIPAPFTDLSKAETIVAQSSKEKLLIPQPEQQSTKRGRGRPPKTKGKEKAVEPEPEFEVAVEDPDPVLEIEPELKPEHQPPKRGRGRPKTKGEETVVEPEPEAKAGVEVEISPEQEIFRPESEPKTTALSTNVNEQAPQTLRLVQEPQESIAPLTQQKGHPAQATGISSAPSKSQEASSLPSKTRVTPTTAFAAPSKSQKKEGENGAAAQIAVKPKFSFTTADGLQNERNLGSTTPQRVASSLKTSSGASDGSPNKDVLFDELKAMKIASIQARNASLEAEIAAKRARLQEVTEELEHSAAETVKRHIKLLHDYNDIRDVGQGLVGMIADNRGVRIGELYDEFGVGLKD